MTTSDIEAAEAKPKIQTDSEVRTRMGRAGFKF
jgi:hypothetical protein